MASLRIEAMVWSLDYEEALRNRGVRIDLTKGLGGFKCVTTLDEE